MRQSAQPSWLSRRRLWRSSARALGLLVAVLMLIAGASCTDGEDAAAVETDSQAIEVTGANVQNDRQPNALIDEQSLYLRQHAHNPVYWYPWGDEALGRAKDEDKLIFLSIGYSSCHWCHVMEEEVFTDEEVGAYLSENFICIKVDREERPDIDAVYMEAMLLLRGSGGWPLNMFLTPDLKPFFGSTYMPKDQFLTTAQRILELREKDPLGIVEAGQQLTDYIGAEPEMGQGAEFTAADLTRQVESMAAVFDHAWGGPQSAQKFPTPARWRFVLHYYRKTGDESAAERLRLTLDRMADGGLMDQLGGGFHRYTVDPQWIVPHFEKMLYDNAQLAELYTEAAAVFADEGYAATARLTLDFMVRELSDGGGLFASYDADSGGEEGTYYVWRPEELTAVAGERDGQVLARVYGVTAGGNFEGASVLTRRAGLDEVAAEFGLTPEEVRAIIDNWHEALLEHRAAREAPALDKKVVTAWNGQAISALARGYALFGDRSYLDAAKAAADYVEQRNRLADGSLARASTAGTAVGRAVLDDYAALACGLLELYSASADLEYLRRARQLTDYALEHFTRAEGGFYFTDSADTVLPVRKFLVYDSVEPSGNSMMAHALLRLAALTGEAGYYSALDSMLESHAALLRDSGAEMAWLLDAQLLAGGPYYDVVLAGDTATGPGRDLLTAYNQLLPCHAVLSVMGATAPEGADLELIPAWEGKQVSDPAAAVGYVCVRGSCKSPAETADGLRDQLLDGWQY